MPATLTKVSFSELAPGEEFRFSRHSDSGLLADLDVPGDRRYRKVSTRCWEVLINDGQWLRGRCGTVRVVCWKAS